MFSAPASETSIFHPNFFICVNCVLTGGPPDNVNNVSVALTACGLVVVQWSEPSSDPVCGTVWYTVTISTEGGILIITDNTTMTNYSVTGGLNNNTVYHVNVTASNNAGSSGLTSISVSTNSIGKFVYAFSYNYIMYMI